MDSKKQTFSHNWLEDENFKSWIKKVPNDSSSYFCVPCNKTFSCSSRVSRHAESKAHRKNVLNNCPEETKTVEKKSHKGNFINHGLKMNDSNHSWKKSQMILTIVFIPFAIQHFDVVLTRLNGILTRKNIFQSVRKEVLLLMI